MTKKKIEKLARDIRKFLDDKYVNGSCRIYFNGMCWEHGEEDAPFSFDKETRQFLDVPARHGWKTIEDIHPEDYVCYYDGVITMTFEGSFYHVVNGEGYEMLDEFDQLIKAHGCYYEQGDTWYISIYED